MPKPENKPRRRKGGEPSVAQIRSPAGTRGGKARPAASLGRNTRAGVDAASGEMVCPFCATGYHYAQERRCWECDGPSCPQCVSPDNHPLCPECVQNLSLPRHIQPMLATLSKLPASQSGWAYEFKWDGVRALCYWDGKRLLLESRNLLNITFRYPEFHDLALQLGDRPVVLDGEIVALDRQGSPSFPLLQQRMHISPDRVAERARQVPAHYFVFDILHLGRKSLMQEPYLARRKALESLGIDHPQVKVPPHELEDGEAMLQTARDHRLEGIVAKRTDSPYEPGRRSRQWLKIKIVQAQELVIGGWTPEINNAGRIGSLLVGYYEDSPHGPRLRYAGSVGTGFTDAENKLLVPRLKQLERSASPFADTPRRKNMRPVAPQLVAHVAYRRWPAGGQIHQASYKGLRADKPPHEVVRERPR